MKRDEQTHDMTGWCRVWFMHLLSWFLFAGDERRRDQVTWYFHTRCSREVQWREGQQPAPNVGLWCTFHQLRWFFLRSCKVRAPRNSMGLSPINAESNTKLVDVGIAPGEIQPPCQGFATDRMIFRDDELSYALGTCCWWLCWYGFEACIGHAGHTLTRQRRSGSQNSSNCPTIECDKKLIVS